MARFFKVKNDEIVEEVMCADKPKTGDWVTLTADEAEYMRLKSLQKVVEKSGKSLEDIKNNHKESMKQFTKTKVIPRTTPSTKGKTLPGGSGSDKIPGGSGSDKIPGGTDTTSHYRTITKMIPEHELTLDQFKTKRVAEAKTTNDINEIYEKTPEQIRSLEIVAETKRKTKHK